MSISFSRSALAQQWLEQFAPGDQASACELLDCMLLVSSDEFKNQVQEAILQWAAEVNGPVGLYAEREGLPVPLFAEDTAFPRRASGPGPVPIAINHADFGSEAIIAQLVSELCRSDERFLNHPGPDEIRSRHMRAFLIVTDFVGSGDRIHDYLQAAWQVHSVRSWWSLHLLSFGVVAYSASKIGAKKVRRHPSHPTLSLVRTCPTIDTEFSNQNRERIRSLCERYDPVLRPFAASLGWGNVGALIVFSHGIPDNAPNILWQWGSSPRSWVPLFPGRATVGRREHFGHATTTEKILHRLASLRQYRLSVSPRLERATRQSQQAVLVLAALAGRGAKTEETIASKTGLNVVEVRRLVRNAQENGLADARLRLTDAGQRELAYFRRDLPPHDVSVENNAAPYYPRALRPPTQSS